MNPKLKSSLLAACTALALTGGVAYATNSDHSEGGTQAAHMHRHGHHGSALMSTLKQLDLTAEQQQSVHAVFQTSGEQRKALGERRKANHEALATILPDDPKYPALIEERKRLASQAIQQASETESQIYALLTPEQKAKLPQLLAERKAQWDQRRQSRQSPSSKDL